MTKVYCECPSCQARREDQRISRTPTGSMLLYIKNHFAKQAAAKLTNTRDQHAYKIQMYKLELRRRGIKLPP